MTRQIRPLLYFLCGIVLCQCKTAQVADVKTTLENTYWKLTEMNGEPVITGDNEKEVHLILTQEGGQPKLKGFAGCNSIGGTYALTGNKLKFTVISTKMMCDPSHMAVENFLVGVLASATTYSIDGETLELLDGDTSLADFKAVNHK
jgi:heat shock protein HslJ